MKDSLSHHRIDSALKRMKTIHNRRVLQLVRLGCSGALSLRIVEHLAVLSLRLGASRAFDSSRNGGVACKRQLLLIIYCRAEERPKRHEKCVCESEREFIDLYLTFVGLKTCGIG